MNSREDYHLNDAVDRYLRQGLKNWASEQQTPETVKARLLLIAAAGGLPADDLPASSNQHGLRDISKKSDYSRRDMAADPFNHTWLWVQHLTLFPLRYGT